MKKLLLITFLFLITPDAKADMDYVCITNYDDAVDFILENCERNNILVMVAIPEVVRLYQSSLWCRQDREIHFHDNGPSDLSVRYDLSCVLYDNKTRKLIIKR